MTADDRADTTHTTSPRAEVRDVDTAPPDVRAGTPGNGVCGIGTTGALPHRRRPCAECPWRRDTPPGQFPADRYAALASTSGAPGAEALLDAPMFACHKTAEGQEQACAGWLAVVGAYHLGVRLAVATGRLAPETLRPTPGWPPLFESFQQMAATQGCSPSTAPARRGVGAGRGGGTDHRHRRNPGAAHGDTPAPDPARTDTADLLAGAGGVAGLDESS